MNILLVVLAVLGGAIALYLLNKKSGNSKPDHSSQRHVPAPAQTPRPIHRPVPSAETTAEAAPRAAIPPELASFHLARSDDIPKDQRQNIIDKLRHIPRPPSSLHKLVAPEFLANASSAEISELMMGEPQITAKILAVVNSPLYGLSRPLASIGQAATFLGTNTVRGICLQYLLDESLQAGSPEIKKVFDQIWDASAFASELSFKLAQLLGMPEPGVLATQVVLSYLGRLACYSLLPQEAVTQLATKGLLERYVAEQQMIALTSAEIGSLLLTEWSLPPSIVAAVRGIDLVLVTPFSPSNTVPLARHALCYLCVRLGEQLASGTLTDLRDFDLSAQTGPDFYYLAGYLELPGLHRLSEYLHFPEVVSSTNKMVSAMRLRR